MDDIIKAASKLRFPFACKVNDTIYLNKSPIDHAEMEAVRNVTGHNLTMFTTAEPCPMCMAAIIWSGRFSKVIYGTDIPTLIKNKYKQSSIRAHEVLESFNIKPSIILQQQYSSFTDRLYL